jgi:hypothetical protein
MDVSTLSLAALEARARGLRDEAALLRMAEILNRDRRAGARLLSERCRHRATRRRRERLRGRRLLALRGRLVAGGARLVAGVDEVGMGPLAGPVVAAAVVLPDRIDLPPSGSPPGPGNVWPSPSPARPWRSRSLRCRPRMWTA